MNIVQKVAGSMMNIAANFYFRKYSSYATQASDVSLRTLQSILTLHQDTAYGKKYNFPTLKTTAEYKVTLPLTTYSDYLPYVERIAEGEKNVLTSDKVIYFGLSSGTTGKQKMVPVTARSRGIAALQMSLLMQGAILRAIPGARKAGRGLMLVYASHSKETEGGIPTGAATSGGIDSMKRFIPYMWTTPPEVFQLTDYQLANYLHLLYALREKGFKYISAAFASSLYDIFAMLEKCWRQLVQDVATGKISANLPIEATLRTALENKMRPNPRRAEELEREFKKGFAGIARRIWPNFAYVCGVAGGSFEIYVPKIKWYIANTPIFSGAYGATEGLVAICLSADCTDYAVMPHVAYHEFIPANEVDSANPRCLDLHELKLGESYEVVVTSYCGFYRYRLGDMVKISGYFHNSPILQFLYRRGQLLNLVGEKTSEQALHHSLSAAQKLWQNELVDFTTSANAKTSPANYVIFMELQEPTGIATTRQGVSILEAVLAEANPRYLVNRSVGKLGELELRVVQPGTFQALKNILHERGASLNQLKIPRVIQDDRLIDFLNSQTIKSGGKLNARNEKTS